MALGAGCAGSTRATPVTAAVAADQERMVLDLRAKNAGYVRHIEELENRIFILEDQLDSRALASEQRAPATLPGARVLRAAPPGGGAAGRTSTPAASRKATASASAGTVGALPPPGLPVDEPAAAVQTSIVAEHAVDYAGEAAQGATPTPTPAPEESRGRRPVLRLSSGASAASRAGDSGTSAARERPARMVAARAVGAPEPLADSNLVVPARATPDPLRLYRDALESLRGGHQEVALAGFRRFLEGNPSHDYADNAQYWIGECHYDQRQFRAAERAFRAVVERYPHGNKVPDAMLKLGFTLQSLGDEAGGRAVLESLARAFPKHEAARLASERLAHPEPPPLRGSQPSALGTVLPLSTAQIVGGAAPPAARAPGGRR